MEAVKQKDLIKVNLVKWNYKNNLPDSKGN